MPRSAALSVLLMLVLASGSGAQTISSTTGAIDGRVTDASNAARLFRVGVKFDW